MKLHVLRAILTVGVLHAVVGCVDAVEDPAKGGFVSGVSGITSGSYDARIDELNAEMASAETRNTQLSNEQRALAGQISAAESQLAMAQAQLARQRQTAGQLDSATAQRVNAAISARPSATNDDAQLRELQKAISDARKLSLELTRLSG